VKIIEPGHVYSVANVDGPGEQTIRFVRRRDEHAKLLEESEEGILSQELLRVLIDRVRYLNDEDPCAEDVEIIVRLRESLRLFETRASRRTIEKMPMVEMADACPICHHLLCAHRHPESDRLEHEVRR
jgi:hypothetical protein